MKFLFAILMLLMVSIACAKKDGVKQSPEPGGEVSAVNVSFNDSLPAEVRAKLTNYHLEIRPIDEKCKAKQAPSAINEKGEWPAGEKLKLSNTVARGCEYNLRLKFGELVEGREFWYLANHKTEEGDELETKGQTFETNGPTANPTVKICLTKKGIEAGLAQYIDCMESTPLTDVEISVDFGEGFDLRGEYRTDCQPNAEGSRWVNRILKINSSKLELHHSEYLANTCADEDLAYQEDGRGSFVIGFPKSEGTEFVVHVTDRFAKAGPKFDLGDYCGKSKDQWQAAQQSQIDIVRDPSIKDEVCKSQLADLRKFDLVGLNFEKTKLYFGKKTTSTDGSSSEKRPSQLDRSAWGTLIKSL